MGDRVMYLLVLAVFLVCLGGGLKFRHKGLGERLTFIGFALLIGYVMFTLLRLFIFHQTGMQLDTKP